ncbi:MAG: 1-(5-phosphoribosyl)-5-[(5-phosphoribosylamino)methylideneamino]imidazole-4-carboxamide isomerase [Candidatus Omnitrophica bacterium]|nr:1-(5-phosphoribosyl)-5-[(5-phosphoribosylamino)methylideneamino]imidazole-4-carboxamide isomerase [Candidatus Omnitrophota bacterium]MBU4149335.1 1-(5-phosphoribosyl)-5-[(5-phosphoribosylamino)methylideneamino]imidazole-4-carboxamide isomerase [Candidatus Omnitrophota bacterium]
MIIIPAIDIIRGRVVRLHQGDFSKETFYSDDPVETALMWQKKGATLLHIVDLDGARLGEIKNRTVIDRIIKKVSMSCEVGGGIRDEKDIEYFLRQGAKRVVLGTRALENPDYLEGVISKFGEGIVVSIDFAGKKVVKKGWQEDTDLKPDAVANQMQKLGVRTIEVTDIAMDGTLKGPNMEMLKKVLAAVDISVIASGGISSLDDIKALRDIDSKHLEGVIIGRALYEGKFDLAEAIRIAETHGT